MNFRIMILHILCDIEPFISTYDWLNQFKYNNDAKPEDMELFPPEEKDFPILCYLMITIKLIFTLLPLKS